MKPHLLSKLFSQKNGKFKLFRRSKEPFQNNKSEMWNAQRKINIQLQKLAVRLEIQLKPILLFSSIAVGLLLLIPKLDAFHFNKKLNFVLSPSRAVIITEHVSYDSKLNDQPIANLFSAGQSQSQSNSYNLDQK